MMAGGPPWTAGPDFDLATTTAVGARPFDCAQGRLFAQVAKGDNSEGRQRVVFFDSRRVPVPSFSLGRVVRYRATREEDQDQNPRPNVAKSATLEQGTLKSFTPRGRLESEAGAGGASFEASTTQGGPSFAFFAKGGHSMLCVPGY